MMDDLPGTSDRRFSESDECAPLLLRGKDEDVVNANNVVTFQSEISMSVGTDESSQLPDIERRRSVLENLLNRQHDGDEVPRPRNWRGLINVEPLLLMVAISMGFYITSQPIFMYWARCVEILNKTKGYDVANASEICADLSSEHADMVNVIEKDIASTKIYLQVVNTVPTLIMAPVIGTWSDKHGRRGPLLFTVCGFMMYMILQLLSVLMYESINIYYWFFAAEMCIGFTGGIGCMFGNALAVVTDDCRHKLKPGSSTVPLRIGIASFTQSIGTLLGTFGMSLMAVQNGYSVHDHKISYINAAVIQVAFAIMGTLYTAFLVRETHFPHKSAFMYDNLAREQSSDSAPPPPPSGDSPVNESKKSILVQMKDNILALGEVLTAKRPGWTRCCLLMSLMFVMVEFLALDTSLLFLLVKKEPFSWSDRTFGYFSLARGLLFSLGMVLCPLLLTLVHWLGKDSLMIVFGIAASAASFFMLALAKTTFEIFMTSGFAILCGGIPTGYRSFLPRMVPKEQTARLLTICSIIMAFCPMLSTLIFNSIYNATLEWWPGFAFFVGGLLQVFVVFGQSGVHMLMRPQWLAEKRLKAQMSSRTLTAAEQSRRDDLVTAATAPVTSLPTGTVEGGYGITPIPL